MRTIVDLPDDQVRALARLCARHGLSRAEVVRRAVAAYLAAHPETTQDDVFGIWSDRGLSGLGYEDRVRAEWSE